MTRRASRRLEHPPLEGEGRRERSERRGGVKLLRKFTPPRLARFAARRPSPSRGG